VQTGEGTRKPPGTHSQHRLCDLVEILAADHQTAENQIAEIRCSTEFGGLAAVK
jgi:hypothetical protein